jgi:hypothetical protein
MSHDLLKLLLMKFNFFISFFSILINLKKITNMRPNKPGTLPKILNFVLKIIRQMIDKLFDPYDLS